MSAHAQAPPFQDANRTAASVFKGPHLAELADAACKGDVEGVEQAVKAGADPNGLSVDGGPPLLWTVYCDNPTGVQTLLAEGANPNLKARGKYSPTFAAATAKNPEILRLLLKDGGDPNADDGGQWTVIRWALETGTSTGRWENYYSLLDGGADINRIGPAGLTIAIEAAFAGRFDKVEELLDRGYSRDLDYLGASVQNRLLANSDAQQAIRERVIAKLKGKGVHFPVQPLHRRMR